MKIESPHRADKITSERSYLSERRKYIIHTGLEIGAIRFVYIYLKFRNSGRPNLLKNDTIEDMFRLIRDDREIFERAHGLREEWVNAINIEFITNSIFSLQISSCRRKGITLQQFFFVCTAFHFSTVFNILEHPCGGTAPSHSATPPECFCSACAAAARHGTTVEHHKLLHLAIRGATGRSGRGELHLTTINRRRGAGLQGENKFEARGLWRTVGGGRDTVPARLDRGRRRRTQGQRPAKPRASPLTMC